MKKQLRLLLPVMLLVGAQLKADLGENLVAQLAHIYNDTAASGKYSSDELDMLRDDVITMQQYVLAHPYLATGVIKATQLGVGAYNLASKGASAIGMGYEKMKSAMNATVDAVSSKFAPISAYFSPKFQAMSKTLLSSPEATFAWINQDRTHQVGSIAALVAVASGLGYVYRENLKAALKKVKEGILGQEKLVEKDIDLLAEVKKHESKLEELQ